MAEFYSQLVSYKQAEKYEVVKDLIENYSCYSPESIRAIYDGLEEFYANKEFIKSLTGMENQEIFQKALSVARKYTSDFNKDIIVSCFAEAEDGLYFARNELLNTGIITPEYAQEVIDSNVASLYSARSIEDVFSDWIALFISYQIYRQLKQEKLNRLDAIEHPEYYTELNGVIMVFNQERFEQEQAKRFEQEINAEENVNEIPL